MKQCPQCSQSFDDDTKFCSSCGVPLINGGAEANSITAVDAQVTEFDGEYEFSKSKITQINVDTTVKIKGTQIDIEQYKFWLFIPLGMHKVSLNVMEIQDVVKKKSISAEGVIIFLCALVIFWMGRGILTWALLAISLFTLRDSNVHITYRNGYIKIAEDFKVDSKMNNFIKYVQHYNPDAVRVNLD